MKSIIFVTLLSVGVVDRIEDEIALVQVTEKNQAIHEFDIPLVRFPCEIQEGDHFHFVYSEGEVEIQCGPPQQAK